MSHHHPSVSAARDLTPETKGLAGTPGDPQFLFPLHVPFLPQGILSLNVRQIISPIAVCYLPIHLSVTLAISQAIFVKLSIFKAISLVFLRLMFFGRLKTTIFPSGEHIYLLNVCRYI